MVERMKTVFHDKCPQLSNVISITAYNCRIFSFSPRVPAFLSSFVCCRFHSLFLILLLTCHIALITMQSALKKRLINSVRHFKTYVLSFILFHCLIGKFCFNCIVFLTSCQIDKNNRYCRLGVLVADSWYSFLLFPNWMYSAVCWV